MACILRVIGENLDVDDCLTHLKLLPDNIWRKGEPTGRKTGRTVYAKSGFTILVSGHDGDQVPRQIEDATCFLKEHGATFTPIAERSDVEVAYLDFAWWFRLGEEEPPAQFHRFPPELLLLSGQAKLAIEISVYATEDDAE